MKIIDAHHHFWDPVHHYYPWLCDEGHPHHRYGDHSSLKRPYLPADYRRDTSMFELAGSVYMEADWDPKDPIGEMRFIETLRQDGGLPSVAIGQAWLHQDDAEATLEQLATFDFVRGIRQKPRANASPGDNAPGGMTDAAWLRGYALLARHGFHYELQTPYWHLHEAAAVARDFPGTRIVVNHTGMPSDRRAEDSPPGARRWRWSPHARTWR
jgi:predicted TIM-barrel fold metal-dependent hydrolase